MIKIPFNLTLYEWIELLKFFFIPLVLIVSFLNYF